MTTVSGQLGVNFTTEAAENPYVSNPVLTYATANRLEVLSAGAGLRAAALTGVPVEIGYAGTMSGSGIAKSKIELGYVPGAGEYTLVSLRRPATGAGYMISMSGSTLRLWVVYNWTDLGGAGGGILATATGVTLANGSQVDICFDYATNTVYGAFNGTPIGGLSATDTTFNSGLKPYAGFIADSLQTHTILSFAADGLASSSRSISASVLEVADTQSAAIHASVYTAPSISGAQTVTLSTPYTPASGRIETTPIDLQAGWIIAWGNAQGTGSATVLSDGRWYADSSVTAFDYQVWNGSSWSAVDTIYPVPPAGANISVTGVTSESGEAQSAVISVVVRISSAITEASDTQSAAIGNLGARSIAAAITERGDSSAAHVLSGSVINSYSFSRKLQRSMPIACARKLAR